MKKFELIADSKITVFGVDLFRIKALVSFGSVAAGDIGGYIQKEENISQEGNAWVSGDARVYGNAWVSGDAWVYGNAWVSGDALVSGNAWVSGDALVYGNARVSGNARVYGDARVSGDARVYGNAWVSGDARVYGNAWVSGDALVSGNARVSGDARVSIKSDLMWISNIGSDNGTLTIARAKVGLFVSRGCFSGSINDFANAVEKRHSDSETGKQYKLIIELAKIRFGV